MAYTERYANFDLTTGLNDGTSEANAWQSDSDMLSGMALGDRVNIKKTSSRYSTSTVWSIGSSFNASATQRLWLRGYGSTIGDGVMFEMDFGSSGRLANAADKFRLDSLDIEGSRTDYVVDSSDSADGAAVANCKIVNTNTGANDARALRMFDGVVMNCYLEARATNSTTAAVVLDRSSLKYSFVKSTRIGVYIADAGFWCTNVQGCVIVGNGASATRGIDIVNYSTSYPDGTYSDNTIYNFDTGIYFDSMPAPNVAAVAYVVNNIFYDIGTGINNAGSATSVWGAIFANNGFGSITTANYSGFTDNESQDDYTISTDPFTDKDNDDFSLKAGSDPIAAGIDAGGWV